MNNSGTLRRIIGTALLAAAPALFPAPAAAAPKPMIVLSSAAYGSGPLTQEMAGGIATDAGENIYVTGGSDLDLHTVKYSKLLVQGPAQVFPNSLGQSITTDNLGDIIVAGKTTGANPDYLTLKYNPGFTGLISSAVYNGSGLGVDSAAAVKTDSQNNIFVTGATFNGLNNDFYTIKYGPNLNILSTDAYDSGGRDEAAALAVDHADNVIVAGFTGTGAAANFYIIKYDNDLKVIQHVAFDGGNIDQATGVAVDSVNNIIVTGNQFDGTGFNYCTLKYDAFLNFVSSAVYDSGASRNDIPVGVAVDSNDNITVTGHSGPGFVSFDYFTIKYDRNFAVISSSTYDGGSLDTAAGITVDASDNVLVTGTSNNGVTNDFFTIKYNASPKIKAVSPAYIGETFDVALDGNGFLASSSVTFTDPGISTGAITFSPGQLRVSATLASSVMLGITTVTVTNLNGEAVSSYALASTRLRKTIPAGGAGALAAQARAGQVKVDIPAGTFSSQEVVTIYAVPAAAGNPSPVGEALRMDVSPAGAVAQQDIIITLPYSPADLGGYNEAALSLAYLSTASVWVPLATAVDQAGNSVSARTRVVNTDYAVVKAAVGSGGGGGGAGGSGIPAKTYPNPYRPGSGGSFDQSDMGEGIVFAELEPGKSIKLTIVDVAGRLVYQKSGAADSQGRFLWDTKTASGGKAASGVYLYTVTGGGEPRKGKVGIIR